MPKSPLSAVLQDERASIDQQIQKLERRRTGIDELLKQYSDSASPAGRTTKPASTQKGALSNMEMVRQVLKAKHAEMNVKEIRVGIREKFRVEASKNLPQLLHKAFHEQVECIQEWPYSEVRPVDMEGKPESFLEWF